MHTEFRNACSTVAHSQRLQPYRHIHKAIRLAMMGVLDALASVDVDAPDALDATLAKVEQLLDLCDSHLRHENAFMHEALRTRDPDGVLSFDRDHATQQQAALALAQLVQRLRQSSGAAEEGDVYQLYLMLSVHVADHLRHMAEEETLLTRRFWAQFSDQEIAAIEGRLVASLMPAERQTTTYWLLRAVNHRERMLLLGGMRDAMPDSAFDALLDQLRDWLPQAAWHRVEQAHRSNVAVSS